MKIEFRFRDVPATDDLKAHASRQLAFQLSRFAGEISRVSIRWSDENGPKGGPDKRCLITLRGRRIGTLRIESTHEDAKMASSMAIERLARSVGRSIEKTRDHHKSLKNTPDLVLT